MVTFVFVALFVVVVGLVRCLRASEREEWRRSAEHLRGLVDAGLITEGEYNAATRRDPLRVKKRCPVCGKRAWHLEVHSERDHTITEIRQWVEDR